MKKCILSVVGKDKVGITAGVCGVLADAGVNILDINQTILQEYFTMVVLVDIDTSSLQFGEIARRLEEYGKTSGMEMVHIITKLPITVIRLVMIWITSVDRLVDTTSIS